MIRILANDDIHPDGKLLLEEAGYEVITDKIEQKDLAAQIGTFDVLLVRSATKVTREIIDAGKKLKIIGRGGVGMDNIDVEYAKSKGIKVINTPKASSRAVAEMAFAHIFSLARYLHNCNRELPHGDFKTLKKNFGEGIQVSGSNLGIIGFGRIGQEVAKIGLGLGMKIFAYDPYVQSADIGVQLGDNTAIKLCVTIETVTMDKLLKMSDFVTVHVPGGTNPLIGEKELATMRDGVIVVNTARGGVIDEDVLLAGLNSGKIAGAGIDVFLNEPNPRNEILQHPKVSMTPHTGAGTVQAQSYIGMELADEIITYYGD
jgi:D-3-phosphoglycerate dehydrogenase / 2-oxoglutarate reductase